MKDIPGWEGLYAITRDGRMWSYGNRWGASKKGRWAKEYPQYKGYTCFVLCRDGCKLTVLTHKLVAITYIPNLLNRREINHKNGIKTDNRVENLEWCTHKENMRHAYATGLVVNKIGQDHNNAKLTNLEVLEIREIYKNRSPKQRDVAKIYGVDPALIWRIIRRKCWKHI